MLQEEDIAELVKKNIQLLESKFGGWINTNVELYVDVSKLPNLTPECVYQKEGENLIFNGVDFLEIEDVTVLKKVLLEEIQREQRKEYTISRDRGIVNLVLFRKKEEHKHVPVHQQEDSNEELIDARRKALFLFDLFLEYHDKDSQLVKNVLCNICECAYNFATENTDKESQLCKLFRILKEGKHLGAFGSLASDFMDTPKKEVSFLNAVNTKLEPQAIHERDSWARLQAPDFNQMIDSLRAETQPARQQEVSQLRERLDDLEYRPDIESRREEANEALLDADASLDDVKNSKVMKDTVKSGNGLEINKLRELVNMYLLFSLQDKNAKLPGHDRVYESLSKEDTDDIIENFATKNEIQEWSHTATLYDLF